MSVHTGLLSFWYCTNVIVHSLYDGTKFCCFHLANVRKVAYVEAMQRAKLSLNPYPYLEVR